MTFQCKMHEYMDMLVQSKHARGSPYQFGERKLHEFDQFIMERFSDTETITKEVAEAWTEKDHMKRLERGKE